MHTNDEVKKKYRELAEALKSQRDEIGLKVHLANMEVQDEWRALEDKWQQLQNRISQIERELEGSGKEVGKVIHEHGEELKDSYRRIRKLL